MSTAGDSGHPKPRTWIGTFSYIAQDDETAEGFQTLTEAAFLMMVEEVARIYADRIEILRPLEMPPPTDVKERDDV